MRIVARFLLLTFLLTTFLPAYAALWSRENPNDVIPPDWVGTWYCNLDGRGAQIIFDLRQEHVCNGDECVTGSYKLFGMISDSGGPWRSLNQRDYDSHDMLTSREDHLLPLKFEDENHWMLMMHTLDRNYVSGYTRWDNAPYGIQCSRG